MPRRSGMLREASRACGRAPHLRDSAPGAVASVLIAALAAAASGQEVTTGTIAGRVLDEQGAAIPGASVVLRSALGARSFESDGRGRFLAPFLTPGAYAVGVEKAGFRPLLREGVVVRLGRRVELDVTLALAGRVETLDVAGAVPAVDLSTSAVGVVLDTRELEGLPVGRRFTELLYLAPGVSSSDVGGANPSIAGGSGLENHYVLDGVDITQAGYGAVGSYSIRYGSLGNGTTTDLIQEIQVKSAGIEAEHGQATGGVVNVVTRSGTNGFHGSIFGYLQPRGLEAVRRRVETPLGTVNATGDRRTEFGVSASGPLLRDRLFAFAAVNPQHDRLTQVAPRGSRLESLGEVERGRRFLAYAASLSWQPGSAHRLDASAFGDPGRGALGPQHRMSLLAEDTGQFSAVRYGGHHQALKYSGAPTRGWLVEAVAGRASNRIVETPAAEGRRVSDYTVVPRRITGGLGFHEVGNDSEKRQLGVKSTHVFEAGGQHELRYGLQLEWVRYDNPAAFTGPPLVLPDGVQTHSGVVVQVLPAPELPEGRPYSAFGALSPGAETDQRYNGVFLQDTWRLGRLTLRPGLRHDRQTLIGSDDPGVLVCRERDSRPGAGDGSGPPTACRFTFSGNWAPRLGGTWDPSGRGRSKLFASWGRYFAQIPNDLAASAMSARPTARAEYYDAGLSVPVPNGVVAGPNRTRHFVVFPGSVSRFDPGARSTFVDEWAAGLEMEIGAGLSFGARHVRRDMPRVLEDVGQVSLAEYFTNPEVSEQIDYYFTNPGPDTPVMLGEGRFEKPVHRYRAMELTVERRRSDGWGLRAWYRWSRLSGTYEGFYRSDNGQSDPALTSLYDFPTDDPGYAAHAAELGFRGDIRYQGSLGQGPLPNDRAHQAKLYASLSRGSLTLGLALSASSGRPLTPLAANPVYNNAGEIPEAPRGSGIPTLHDGFRRRSPPEIRMDVHAGWTLALNGARRVVAVADAFNLLDGQRPTNYDTGTELGFGISNPNYGAPTAGVASPFSALSAPRQVRVGARLEW